MNAGVSRQSSAGWWLFGPAGPCALKDVLEDGPCRRVVGLPPIVRLGVVEHRRDAVDEAARRNLPASVAAWLHNALDVVDADLPHRRAVGDTLANDRQVLGPLVEA